MECVQILFEEEVGGIQIGVVENGGCGDTYKKKVLVPHEIHERR